MGEVLRNWRIYSATLIALLCITGAYLLARGLVAPPIVEASPESALMKAIAAKDADGDGLPDWQEALYGTDPHVVDSRSLGMSDGQAVEKGLIIPKAIADIPAATSTSAGADSNLPPPSADGTLTDVFSRNFFALYISAKQANGGADLSESEMQAIADQAIKSITSTTARTPDFKSAQDLRVSKSGAEGLTAFAADAETVLKRNTADASMNELGYLQNAVLNNDTTAIAHLSSIAKAYRDSAVGIAALSVPAELVSSDLLLINSLMRLSEIINDFTRVSASDNMAAILALEQYPDASHTLSVAFIQIYDVYRNAGVVPSEGTPGASFVNLIAKVAASQAAAKKP